MKTKLTVFSNGDKTSYIISRYDFNQKIFRSCPISKELGQLILKSFPCTLYKQGVGFTIYNL